MRGRYEHRARAKQLLLFDGLRWGNITPTDLDTFIDFGGRAFVLVELKLAGTELKRGQELAIERAVDTWNMGGVTTLALVATHGVEDPNEDVVVADAFVVRLRIGYPNMPGAWQDASKPCTVRDAVEWFRKVVATNGMAA